MHLQPQRNTRRGKALKPASKSKTLNPQPYKAQTPSFKKPLGQTNGRPDLKKTLSKNPQRKASNFKARMNIPKEPNTP